MWTNQEFPMYETNAIQLHFLMWFFWYLNLWLWLSAANQLWKILNQLKSEDVIESILNCEKMWKAMETERRCNLRTLVFTVFSRFLKATYSTSVSGIRINFMFKICQIVPDLFHKFLKPYCWLVFFYLAQLCDGR